MSSEQIQEADKEKIKVLIDCVESRTKKCQRQQLHDVLRQFCRNPDLVVLYTGKSIENEQLFTKLYVASRYRQLPVTIAQGEGKLPVGYLSDPRIIFGDDGTYYAVAELTPGGVAVKAVLDQTGRLRNDLDFTIVPGQAGQISIQVTYC